MNDAKAKKRNKGHRGRSWRSVYWCAQSHIFNNSLCPNNTTVDWRSLEPLCWWGEGYSGVWATCPTLCCLKVIEWENCKARLHSKHVNVSCGLLPMNACPFCVSVVPLLTAGCVLAFSRGCPPAPSYAYMPIQTWKEERTDSAKAAEAYGGGCFCCTQAVIPLYKVITRIPKVWDSEGCGPGGVPGKAPPPQNNSGALCACNGDAFLSIHSPRQASWS